MVASIPNFAVVGSSPGLRSQGRTLGSTCFPFMPDRMMMSLSAWQWNVTAHSTSPPEAYRTIKLANLGLVDVADADAELLEVGPNVCAIS